MSRPLSSHSASSPSITPQLTQTRQRLFVLYALCGTLVVLLAFGLRIYQLGGQSVWFDEGWSWHLAGLPLGEMASITAGDRSPALYYVLLHGWMAWAGVSEFALRYFSLCADVVTVVLVMGLARRAGGAMGKGEGGKGTLSPSSFPLPPALLTGLLYTLCPLAVFYAQETRMYALVAMLCTASSYALVRYLQARSGWRWLIISAVCLALAIHSHYYAVFLLPAHAVVVLIGVIHPGRRTVVDRKRAISWVVAVAGVVLSVLPWLVFASGGFAYDDGFAFPLNTIDGRMLEWVRAFVAGGFGAAAPVWGLGALVVAGVFALLGWLAGRRWRGLMWLVALVVVPLLAAAVAVRVVYPYRSVFHPRYLIYIAPIACVLLGGWMGEVRSRLKAGLVFGPLVGVLMALIWLPALQTYFTQPNLVRDDYRTATRHVLEALEPGDGVVMTRDNYAIRYYWQRMLDEGNVTPGVAAPLGPAALDGYTRADVDALLLAAPAGLHGVMHSEDALLAQLNQRQPTRVRMMLWQDNVVDAEKRAETLFWANGYQSGEYNIGQIRLPLFKIVQSPLTALPFVPVDAVFGGTLELQQAWMRQQGVAGDLFYVVLQWKATQTLPLNYKVFVHVLDDEGQALFQKDKLAIDDLRPTSHWRPGESIRDPYSMLIPADVAAGSYRVVVGVYDPATGARLVAKTASGGETDSVELGRLTVQTR